MKLYKEIDIFYGFNNCKLNNKILNGSEMIKSRYCSFYVG